MQAFAHLLDRLIFTSSRNTKIRLLSDYFKSAPDPDRGYALAALTGTSILKAAKASRARALIEERVDPELVRMSYDFVGDTAETVALLWPEGKAPVPYSLSQIVDVLGPLKGKQIDAKIANLLDGFDNTQRWAFLKLITGGLRVGVSARLAKTALADYGRVSVEDIEEIWFGLEPPYTDLFAWLNGKADKPSADALTLFRPVMLAHPIEDQEREALDWQDFCVEWKWDGARVQIASDGETVALYSRSGEKLTQAFPEYADVKFVGVLDGEILGIDAQAALASEDTSQQVITFNALQQRLNRKITTKRLLADYPTKIRLYDCLFDGEEDIRALPLKDRKARLAAKARALPPDLFDLSQPIEESDPDKLAQAHANITDPAIEGFMIKRWDSPYKAGRPKGLWYKYKRDPFLIDAVLLYAQRGHGKRSSLYSDYTFGVLTPAENPQDPEARPGIVPVGKAYSGMTDEELKRIDAYVKANTIERFGPVRSVTAGLVFEVAFEGIQESKRHKSGIALRFPRIHRIRWDKPWQEADSLDTLKALLNR